MSTSRSEKVIILFAGYNHFSEFDGDDSKQPIKELSKYKSNSFNKIFCANAYTIFADDGFKNIYSVGYNSFGQCSLATDKYEFSINKITPITFFKDNNITIKNICTNHGGDAVFYITTDDKLYGCGRLKGLNESRDTLDVSVPKLMPLSNAIDARATKNCCIALCSSNNSILCMIIQNWSRLHTVPDDIITILMTYSKSTTIYSSTNESGSGHPKNAELKNENGWNEVEFFKDKYIVKMETGDDHTIFLDSAGEVYGCGGKLGLGDINEGFLEDVDDTEVYIPQKFPYFEKNGIRIVDVACGKNHTLALDESGKVYSWGYNTEGQCGIGKTGYVRTPRVVEKLDGYKVDLVKVGYQHSYCRSVCGKHFIWGDNEYGGCIVKSEKSYIVEPMRFDDIIERKFGKCEIVEVHPGYFNTKIIVQLL